MYADSSHEETKTDRQDDCYHSEMQAMINVIDGKADTSTLLSSYADAAESYKLVSHCPCRERSYF